MVNKCVNCGYLTVGTKDLYGLGEASIVFREKAQIPVGYDDTGRNQHSLHEPIPLCFARQLYLTEATKNINNKDNPFEKVKKIIQADNACKKFINHLLIRQPLPGF